MHPIYKSKQYSISTRVDNLLSLMTIEEKVGQLLQLPANVEGNTDKLEEWHVGSYLHCTGSINSELQARAVNSRLGIPLMFGIDAIHGHCFDNDSTVFPSQLAASSSWDLELMYKMARITAKETRASGLHWTFSPVLCVARDARWGRIDETYGEDAWLIGEMAAATIKGYQSDDVSSPDSILACAKHYVAYGETIGGRDSYEANVSRRQLLSTFLPPFEKAVKEANVASLMTGYHSNDGVPCSIDEWLLTDVAKIDWKLDGFIVTDWENVRSLHTKQTVCENEKEACYQSLIAGNDMIMSTPEFYFLTIELVQEGRVAVATLDAAVKRILTKKFELGLFDSMANYAPKRSEIMGIKEHHDVSLEASRKGLVLLKNDGILPVKPFSLKKILLVGPNADDVIAQLGDWSFGSIQASMTNDTFHREQTVTLLDALTHEANQQGFELEFIKGADCVDASFDEIGAINTALLSADLVVACVGDTLSQNGEFHDRANLDLTGKQQAMLEVIKRHSKPFVVCLLASKPLTIPWVKEHANAILCGFNLGPKGGQAFSEALFGALNPSGKLTISFPVHVGQIPVYYNKFQGWHAHNSHQTNGEERYIDMPLEPLFSFGEGMSYSRFSYHNILIEQNLLNPGQDVNISFEIENISSVDGVEITQVYVRDVYSSVTTPVKKLCGFARVKVAAGERKKVRIIVPFDELALINARLQKVVEAGDFEFMIGSSSKDRDLQQVNVTVKQSVVLKENCVSSTN
ncbi:glycoside hydrolase family 3 N-terminal domain-containing protein [Vibrio sp. TH_r3]|uniref:glycoside hydrolase family 3 N-terminal domain-containing protein n=1 Tax=Vibrio sp. TH_r3 TaxID=3082084 RepID=UPI002954C8FE|nr:glycoside hydrolase family 3 N-terminal domain-containing protein [Vibrio sp. TH_r3]MDV7106087.1 glycoside hydrolase family 3 N-terminal domain-containing protein [Vibrio sp. TH_r3]